MTINERLFYLITTKNVLQKDLAKYIGVKSNTISEWKTRGTPPPSDKLILICDFFKVDLYWFITGDDSNINHLLLEEQHLLIKMFEQLNERNKGRILERMDILLGQQPKPTIQEPQSDCPPAPPSAPSRSAPVPGINFTKGNFEEPEALKEVKIFDPAVSAGTGNLMLDSEPLYELRHFPAELVPDKTDFGLKIDGDSMEPVIHDKDIVFICTQKDMRDGDIGVFSVDDRYVCKKINKQKKCLESLNKRYSPIFYAEDARTIGRVLGSVPTSAMQ